MEPSDDARKLFRYVTGDEWHEYRAIMSVFAGTFFSEFSADEVTARLHSAGRALDGDVVADRLESLRRWGNLTVSASVGNPTSISDYYRRRSRYLITRAGQEVHDVVEGVLARVDEVRDVSTGRLRAMHDALRRLIELPVTDVDPVELADVVQSLFDPHEAFTSEITQFFASINQWQSRYDLTPEEFAFFAEVLVGYVGDRLDEIERLSRPIGRMLREIDPRIPGIVERMHGGLAASVESAGLTGVSVTRRAGTSDDDWHHLIAWFVGRGGRPSRMEQLRRDAVSAIRTLTLNLTRLSRSGIGASSRRADFLRLARFVDRSAPDQVARLMVAAFGLHASNHWGMLSADSDDPVASSTPWTDAPRAMVPVSLRERGNTTNRGRATPLRDRTVEERALRRRRELELEARRRVDAELLSMDGLDAGTLSPPALARLEQLLAAAMRRLAPGQHASVHTDGDIECTVTRRRGTTTVVATTDGTLTLHDLDIRLHRREAQHVG